MFLNCKILNLEIRNLEIRNIFATQNVFMGIKNQIAEYLFLKKPDPNRPKTQFVRYMHGINRLSLLIFILCLIILAIKLLR
jgi:hypothetical protein